MNAIKFLSGDLKYLFKHLYVLNGTYKASLRHIYAVLKILIDVFLPCEYKSLNNCNTSNDCCILKYEECFFFILICVQKVQAEWQIV